MVNQDSLEGKWKQLKGKARSKWGKLTDDDLDRIQGRSEELEGLLQERYGMAKDEAKKQVRDFSQS